MLGKSNQTIITSLQNWTQPVFYSGDNWLAAVLMFEGAPLMITLFLLSDEPNEN